MCDKRRKSMTPGSEPAPAAEAIELPERWSAQRKADLVLRLLRGEPLDAVSRESQVTAHELETWSRVFLEQGMRGLRIPGATGGARAHAGPRQDWRTDDEAGAGRRPHRKKGLHGRVEEVRAMTGCVSPSTHRRYPLTMIWCGSSAGALECLCGDARGRPRPGAAQARAEDAAQRQRGRGGHPGRSGRHAVSWRGLSEDPRAPAHRGLRLGGKRVLRLMRLHHLPAPRRLGPPNGDPAHAGTITTTHPDEMWGTDATRFYTEADGWCWFFGAIDHGIDELLGWHVAKLGDRWAALEPIRQGVRHAFGGFQKDIARGLAVRCDWGPQYIADAWINEVKWLGITISPSYVGEPECNGVIERFMRTLKEQCLYLQRFQTLEEARRVTANFIERYNHEWLIERLDYRTPAQARAEGWRAAT